MQLEREVGGVAKEPSRQWRSSAAAQGVRREPVAQQEIVVG